MRRDMIAGLRGWRDAEGARGRVLERIEHAGWSLEQVAAPILLFLGEHRMRRSSTAVKVNKA